MSRLDLKIIATLINYYMEGQSPHNLVINVNITSIQKLALGYEYATSTQGQIKMQAVSNSLR